MTIFRDSNKKLPHLSRYVETMSQRSPESGAAVATGCLASLMLSGGAFIALSQFMATLAAGVLSVFVILPLVTMLAMMFVGAATKPKTEEQERRKEAHEAVIFMNGALQQRKLHKKVNRSVGMLLEECARHWDRVHGALSGTFWEDKDLPMHWKNIREAALTAADRAMDDIIVMLKPVLEARSQKTAGEEFLGDLLESFFNVSSEEPIEPLPAAYLPARDIAQKLMLLADEVEGTAQKAVRDQAFNEHYSSPSQIDVVLGELRAIKEAETELHQEIGRPPEG